MRPVLEIKSIGKRYNIRAQAEPYLSLRESLTRSRWLLGARRTRKDEFWALKDVSFDVMPGETVGIIGRNGAGKSTLLKILSKITPPTKGSVICRGHTASLLEVGTGFHPELTGRENVYLNGSILGLKRTEIARKFDEIVDFAGVERFIDTPLKHYSSGMQLRLAFAVAAFLEPEILIIDEVLAVGDSEFQKKCLGRMRDVSSHGRTILFVSHDLTAVSNLTKRCVFLREGSVAGLGTTNEVIAQYVREGANVAPQYSRAHDGKNPAPQVVAVALQTSMPNNVHEHGKPMSVFIGCRALEAPASPLWLSLHITDTRQRGVIHETRGGRELPLMTDAGGSNITINFPSLDLYMGAYDVSIYLSGPPGGPVYERLVGILRFEVVMNGTNHEFGWIADACVYKEQTDWTVQHA